MGLSSKRMICKTTSNHYSVAGFPMHGVLKVCAGISLILIKHKNESN